jgi:hypothetical protein
MEYRGLHLHSDDDGLWHWHDAFGVIGGEDFDTFDECKDDADCYAEHRFLSTLGPYEY